VSWRELPGRRPEPRPVGASLDRVTQALGVPRSSTLEAVFARWEELVGPAVAGHARPTALRDRRLVVTVDEPGWATQLRWLEADLLARLAETAGSDAVDSLEVRVARG
jgi:predicted nucleic acid-binding Zn ribbon protein